VQSPSLRGIRDIQSVLPLRDAIQELVEHNNFLCHSVRRDATFDGIYIQEEREFGNVNMAY
jgi:hypothetical protein